MVIRFNVKVLKCMFCIKEEAPITDRGPIVDFIFKSHTFLRYISMKAIDNCLKLKLSGIGSSALANVRWKCFKMEVTMEQGVLDWYPNSR
jgi:hypothetical protein